MSLLLSKTEKQAIKRLWPLLGLKKRALAWSTFLGTLALGASTGLAAVSAWLIARASQMPPVMYLNVAVTAVRALGISKALFRYFERLASHRIALEGIVTLRTNVYSKVSSLRSDSLASLGRGQLLNRATGDVDAIGDLVVRVLQPFLVTISVAFLTCFSLSFLWWPAAVWLAICLFLSIFLGITLAAKSTRLGGAAALRSEDQISRLTADLLQNNAEIRSLGKISYFQSEITLAEAENSAAVARSSRASALATAVDNFALGAALIGCSLLGASATSAGKLSFVGLAVIILIPLAAFEGTAMLPNAAAALVRSAGAAVRIDALLQGPQETPSEHLNNQICPSLEAKNIDIGWSDSKILLNDFSMTLSKNSKIAIIGPSGIGKTTLLLTLSGMLPPRNGKVLVSGHTAWNLPREECAKVVSYTPEDAHVFETSVYENLRVSNPSLSREEAIKLLERVKLKQWLETTLHGLDTPLVSGAKNISGGERRRLLVARALASQAPILLLDEPGEHLDSPTADALTRDLLSIPDRAVVLVSHRLSALEKADEIIVLGEDSIYPSGVKVIFKGSFAEAKTNEYVALSLREEAKHA
ncbi:thiol reductant ABC exporter subunit CydC [Actinomycetaceae bacterium TAE3-ERU4]|nr:thiol reductant ABC exporter subunit CydC [Actinomycetaceae bacterium TAE3-ERU4]